MTFKPGIFATLFVMGIHTVLLFTDGYGRFAQIDVPMHLMGGVAMSLLGLALYHTGTKHLKKPLPLWFVYVFVMGFVILIGVLWEFHEFVFDKSVNQWLNIAKSQPSLVDTLKDLLNDWIGGSVAFWVCQSAIEKK